MMISYQPAGALVPSPSSVGLPLKAVRFEAAALRAVLVEQQRMREAARRVLDTSARYFQNPLGQEKP